MFFIYVYLLTKCLLCVVLGRWPPVLRYVLMFFFSSERWHLFECDLSCTKKLSEPTCLFRIAGYVVNILCTDIVKAFNQIAAVTKILSYSFTILISWVEVISLSEWKQDFGKLDKFWNVKGIKRISLRRTYQQADLYFTSVVAVSFSSLSL